MHFCLIKHHFMKTYTWLNQSSTVPNLDTTRRCVVSFTLLSLYPQGTDTDTQYIGGWVGPRAGLSITKKWNGSLDPTIRHVSRRYTNWAERWFLMRIAQTNAPWKFNVVFSLLYKLCSHCLGVRFSVVGWGTMLQAWRSQLSVRCGH
jgi:hypothetical protein